MIKDRRISVSKPIIIVGPPRSGTSMTAGILYRLGVDFGNIRPPDRQNPTGYFEDMGFLKLIDRIYEAAEPGSNGFRPPKVSSIDLQKDRFREEIRGLLKNREAMRKSDYWGWKATGTSLMLDLFLEDICPPYLVVVLRNPLQIAYSAVRYTKAKKTLYEELNLVEALKNAIYYYDSIFSFLNSRPSLKWYPLSYESVLENPKTEIDNLINFLGLSPSWTSLKRAKDFVMSRSKLKKIKKKINVLIYLEKVKEKLAHLGAIIQ